MLFSNMVCQFLNRSFFPTGTCNLLMDIFTHLSVEINHFNVYIFLGIVLRTLNKRYYFRKLLRHKKSFFGLIGYGFKKKKSNLSTGKHNTLFILKVIMNRSK